jgi:hypothetical protein
VKYLRDKIDRRFGLDLVQTVRGVGYRLAGCPAASDPAEAGSALTGGVAG